MKNELFFELRNESLDEVSGGGLLLGAGGFCGGALLGAGLGAMYALATGNIENGMKIIVGTGAAFATVGGTIGLAIPTP